MQANISAVTEHFFPHVRLQAGSYSTKLTVLLIRPLPRYRRSLATIIATLALTQVILTRRKRSALPITDTELSDIAAAAIIGDSRMPKNGYSTPAATGTPMLL